MSDFEKTYAKLKKIRQRQDLKIRPTKFLKDTITGLDGKEVPLRLRYYQVQAVLHLMTMKRFILGDDTGLGKTLMAIASMCYIWERAPDRKVIVLTTKSATPQWASEFDKFAIGVSTFIAMGTKAKRQKAYQNWQDQKGPSVLIVGYASMRNDFTIAQNWHGHILVLDECFQYHTPIMLADGTTELIGKLVCQERPTDVLTFNPDTGCVEAKPIIRWIRKPLKQGRRADLLHLNFRFGGKCRVTRNHKFYTPAGKIPALKLRKGSAVQTFASNIPSEDQWQFILGGLLGDSCLSGPKRPRWGIQFGHGAKQRAYLSFKREALSSLGVSDVTCVEENGYSKKPYFRFRLNANDAVTSFLVQAQVWQDKKRVTLEWLDRVQPLGLAVWYADDGSLSTHVTKSGERRFNITLSTHDFGKKEVDLLAGWLRWRWGVYAEVKNTKRRSDRTNGEVKTYPYIYLGHDAAVRFLSVLPCGFPGVEYKFPNKPIRQGTDFDSIPTSGLITDWVTEKRVWTPNGVQDKYVYDLEVAGNHNYFANGVLVSNCTAVKNPRSRIHQVVAHLASQADRVWGLTATLIKNNLMEGFGIYKVVQPTLFGSENAFKYYYCLIEMQQIRGGRRIPIIKGYIKERVVEFREKIDPFFLGRAKHTVASELPTLTISERRVDLTPEQGAKYQEALAGLLEIGGTWTKDKLLAMSKDDLQKLASHAGIEGLSHDDTADALMAEGSVTKETTILTQIIYCQQIVDHPALVDCEGGSNKMDYLLDLLSEGDLAGEKVIIFSRFRKMVDLLMAQCKAKKIKATRITGSEEGKQRHAAQKAFQDPNSGVDKIFITMAAGEAVNLQAAKAIVFFDSPWSAGDYLQILGRMIRIGSLHDKVQAIHLVVRDTVDSRVQDVLRRKMRLVESVLGKRIKGEDDKGTIIDHRNEISDLFHTLRQDAVKQL